MMIIRLPTLLLLFACYLSVLSAGCQGSSSGEPPPMIITQSGPLVGLSANGMNEFLGIPYAIAPLGPLRWTPPRAYGHWQGLLRATQFGSECVQPGSPAPVGSENCLFLNVYVPQTRPAGGLPVMVWIHGGGLTSGAGSLYDPARLVAKGTIVVTINYRLGFLGFFAHPALDSEGHPAGNYGLMDQQLALVWIKNNLGAFGGDPTRITIFGESAGGQSVLAHLASAPAAGLFSGAIVESGAYAGFQDYFNYLVTLATAETAGTVAVPSGNQIAARVGCGTMATASCLRAVPASTLVAAEPATLYPFIDGTVLTQTLDAAFAGGDFNRVPVISGTNHDEWRLFVAFQYDLAGNPIPDQAAYNTAVADLWGPIGGSALAQSVLESYPFAAYSSGEVALGASGTDGRFSCPARNAVRLLAQFVTTYAYEFNDEDAPPPQSSLPGLTFPLGAYHSAELQYLFPGGFFGLPSAPLTPEQTQLSAAMVAYWTDFARAGDPNSADQPAWSPYSASTDQFHSLISPAPMAESGFDADHRCSAFWNTF